MNLREKIEVAGLVVIYFLALSAWAWAAGLVG